jgi:hypothetical protein
MSEDRVVEGLPVQAFRVELLPDGTWEWLCLASAECSVSGFGGIADAASAAGRHVAEVHGGLVPAVTTLVATRVTGLRPRTWGRFRAVSPSGRTVAAGDDLAEVRGAAMVWEARMRRASPEEHRAGCACTGGFCWSARLLEYEPGAVVREFVVDPADALVCTVCGHEAMDFQAGPGGLVCVACPAPTGPSGVTTELAALQRLPLSAQDGGRECGDDPDIEVTRGYFGGRAELLAPELFAAGSAAAAAVVDGGREPGRRLPPAVDELVRVTVEGRARPVPGGGFKVVVADGPAAGMSLARFTEVGLQRAWIVAPSVMADGRRWVSLTDQFDYPNYPPGPDSRELGEQLVDLMGAEVEAYREAADRCRVGDADPTPELGAPVCGFEWPVSDWPGVTWSCTRSARHGVQHVAAAGGVVVSVCPMPAGLAERLAPGGAL